MRRLRAFSITALTLAAATFIVAAFAILPERLAFKSDCARYTFYIGSTSKNCREMSYDGTEAALARLTLGGVCGESATYSTLDTDEFLKSVNGEILFVEEMSDSMNYYCKADLPYSVNLYGKEINLHICVKEDGVTVASPIIFGGY